MFKLHSQHDKSLHSLVRGGQEILEGCVLEDQVAEELVAVPHDDVVPIVVIGPWHGPVPLVHGELSPGVVLLADLGVSGPQSVWEHTEQRLDVPVDGVERR